MTALEKLEAVMRRRPLVLHVCVNAQGEVVIDVDDEDQEDDIDYSWTGATFEEAIVGILGAMGEL